MTQFDWSKARKGFDFLFKVKAEKDTGDFYFISPLNDRFVSEMGNYILFRDMKDLPELFEISMRPDDSTWDGSGTPPVGTVCEFNGAGAACPYDPWHPDLKDGDHVTIIAYFNDSVGEIAAFTFKARNENIAAIQVEQARPGAFRPIRTQAQLAAEEREKAVRNMKDIWRANYEGRVEDGLYALYDAGYRKVEVKP